METASIFDESALADLVSLWQRRRADGEAATPAELCRERPELLSELQRRIAVLERMGDLVGNLHEAATLDTVGSANDHRVSPAAYPDLPGYEIVGELGRGGMGVVYKARQKGLNRLVALKMILHADYAGSEEHRRFQDEAEAVARTHHPNIVQVFEVGEHNGLPYLSLEFCAGGSLSDRMDGTPWEAAAAARLVETLARAMEAAHQAQVIHRDLKPGNVLLTAEGEPKVTDFGLAKKLDVQSQTRTGDVMGTPSYMAPEQASGSKAIGPAVDVYALGAILYELLTGRPPFKAASSWDTIQQVIQDEPVSVRRLQPQVSRDLETISLKCLEKNPNCRYGSAQDLAEDLRRFRVGEPIQSRPIGRMERILKWVHRRPTLAAAYSLLLLVLILVSTSGGAALMWRQADAARGQAEDSRDQLDIEKQQTEQARLAAEAGLQREAELRRRLDQVSYLHRIGLALRGWQEGDVARAEQLLEECPAELRHWEWGYISRLCRTDLRTLRASPGMIRFSPDGRSLISVGDNGNVQAWETRTGRLVFNWQGDVLQASVLAFSLDRKRLAWIDKKNRIVVGNVETGKVIASLPGPFTESTSLALSPDGSRLAAAIQDRAPVQVFDVLRNREIHRLPWIVTNALNLAFSPDGRHLVAGCEGGSLRWFDLIAGQELPTRQRSQCEVTHIVFSSDGKLLAAVVHDADDKGINVWDAATGQLYMTFWGHQQPFTWPAFSWDNPCLAVGSSDRTVRVWDLRNGKELLRLRGHRHGVSDVCYGPGGRLASSSFDGTVKVWDTTMAREYLSMNPGAGWVQATAFSPDGVALASAHDDGSVRVWDTATGKALLRIATYTGRTFGVAFSNDGSRLASASVNPESNSGEVRIWDARTGESVMVPNGPVGLPYRVAFSPDGKLLASAGLDRAIRIWDTRTGKCCGTWLGRSCVNFSPDSRRLIYGIGEGGVVVRDLTTDRELFRLKGHTEKVVGLAYSPDGDRIASASYDKTVKVWDSASGQELTTFRGHGNRVLGVAFSPDGRRLASCSDDQTIRVCMTDTAEEALMLKGHLDPVHCLAFSPDGRRIASGGHDQTVRIWESILPDAKSPSATAADESVR